MIESREFFDKFSTELNCCAENENDGIFMTISRLKHFVSTLKEKIDQDNKEILSSIKNEEHEIACSLLNQSEVISRLDYFSDILLQSSIVTIYSFLEYKLSQVAKICEEQLTPIGKIKSYEKNGIKLVSAIEKYNSFLKSEIIVDLELYSENFREILKWNNARKYIVHKSKRNATNLDLSNFNSMTFEYGTLHIKDESEIFDFLILIEDYLAKVVDLINTKYLLIQYKLINS